MTNPAMKRKCGSNDLSPFAVKLPKFERTGNQIDDEKNKNYWIQLQQMITGCQSNPELVPIVYGKFCEAQQMLAQTGEWQLSEMFSPLPKNLYSSPDEVVFEFLVKNSDLQADHLGAIQKRDPKGPHKILLGMIQLPSTLKLEGDMVCRGFINFLCKDRYELCGRRMHNLKGCGNYADGQVFWADCGSYQCDFADNKLIKVQHRSSGDSVDIDPLELYVTTRWQMIDNWSDMNAHFTFGGQPGLKLARDPATGPWKVPHFTGIKQPALQSWVNDAMVRFLEAREAVSGKRGQDDVRQKVNELRTERKKEVIEKAKIAAKAAFQQAKENRKATAKARPKAAAA